MVIRLIKVVGVRERDEGKQSKRLRLTDAESVAAWERDGAREYSKHLEQTESQERSRLHGARIKAGWDRRRRSGPVTVTRVDPEAWRIAMEIVDGNAARLRVISPTEIDILPEP